MRVGSLFSGIGGLDLGLERAGHEVVFQCESDPYRRRVLARHWPGVPCFEDVRDVGEQSRRELLPDGERGSTVEVDLQPLVVDLICGGFPCQDLSVAGRRAGLEGSRSGLFFEFARVADALLPDGGWVLLENVPGLLSSNGGRDFAVLRATLAELGFLDGAYRILDSRYFGVPQRRRRVFILARRSRGRRASEVLLEPESGGGDFEASRAERQGTADGTRDGAARTLKADAGNRWKGADHDSYITAGPLTTRYGKGVNTTADDGATVVSDRVRATPGPAGRMDVGALVSRSSRGRPTPLAPGHNTDEHITLIASAEDHRPDRDPDGGMRQAGIAPHCSLDPRPDGPRYAACGDAVTVNVSYWLGCRLRDYG